LGPYFPPSSYACRAVFQSQLVVWYVSSVASPRPIAAIVDGKRTPGFKDFIAGMFQYFSWPVNIRASSSGVSVRCVIWLCVMGSKIRNPKTSPDASIGAYPAVSPAVSSDCCWTASIRTVDTAYGAPAM
jgi:hypothetical protein